jgi:hypothetical protein
MIPIAAGMVLGGAVAMAVELQPPETKEGYLARLLLNEVPFPGESGWVSETDSKAAMLQILWVLQARIEHVPPGYTQKELAATTTRDIVDVITVGGVHGQCDGFYRDPQGRPATVPRVQERLDYLLGIANQGEPGRFARLLAYGQGLAAAYFRGGIREADRFAKLSAIGEIRVTGRAYSWMQDRDYYDPGGDFVKMDNAQGGSLGGNRFSTLKDRK